MNQHRSLLHPAHARAALGLFIAAALAAPQIVLAGSFQLPTTNAAGWARAGAGGSLYPGDASAVYNNPAATAFFTGPVLQATGSAVRPSAEFKGEFRDVAGNPVSGGNPNGFGKTKFFPNLAFAIPVNDRLTLGTSITVPFGLAGEYSRDWQGRYFGTATSLRSIAFTLSAGFKVNDEFAVGLGLVGQYTKANLNSVIDTAGVLYGLAALNPPQSLDTQLNINVKKKLSFGYIGSFVFKPTAQDSFGFSYHSKIRNELSGKYKIYAGEGTKQLLLLGPALNPLLTGAGLPPFPPINPDGGNASARVDMPAFANLDWVHFFDDRFSLAASVAWTDWSSFQEIALYSQGNRLVGLKQNYKDSWTYSLGGEYKLTPAWTLRAGIGYDETPTSISTRDPRIPDGPRKILGVGVGYQATKNLAVDLGYQHQFLGDVAVRQTNQFILGSGTMKGKFKDSGDVLSLTGTYHF